MLAGQRDGVVLAQLARGRMRDQPAQRHPALTGRLTRQHAWLVGELLADIAYWAAARDRLSAQIEDRRRPLEAAIQRLDTMPGINRVTAQRLFAEMGPDGSRCPSDQPARRRRSGTTRDGNRWIRQALLAAAQGTHHTQHAYFKAH